MIGDEINCIKNIGRVQLNDAISHCKSLNANQILPRSKQEADDLVSALLSLDLAPSENGEILVTIGMVKTKEGLWYDSAGQLISYFNWLPNEPDDINGTQNYAGFSINGVNETARWADYSGTDVLNVVCTNKAAQGKNNI